MLDFVNKVVSKFFGNKSEKDVKSMMPLVEQTNAEFAKLSGLDHDQLRAKTDEFKGRIKEYLKDIDHDIEEKRNQLANNPDMHPDEKEEVYKSIDELIKERDETQEEILADLLPEAFAVVKETARRFSENESIRVKASQLDKDLSVDADHIAIEGEYATYQNSWLAAGSEIVWNMLHYDVQIIGGITLHQGKIAEMATGEGKTLVATLPAYLNGITGQGVHLVTVNDYLARRDSEWMGTIFNFLGLTVDCIDKHRPHSAERIEAYKADITYGTNNEFGFDYLRDNMVRNPDELVTRKMHFAMVDEVDSVLVDDARTPLIISGPVERGDQHQFFELKPRIQKLIDAQRKFVTQALAQAKREIKEGKSGENDGGLALLRSFRGLPKHKATIKYLSEPGVKTILQKTENFYLQEQAKHMPEVDKELYFVIEEKQNSVELTEKGIELITGSGEDPEFFVMPDLGGEMAEIEKSGLSDEEKVVKKDQLIQDFSIKSERLHSVQQLLKAYTLFENDVEYIVDGGKVKIVDEQTGRVMDGRRYSDGLHQAIEAKENVKIEAATQTFATVTLQNYFRMYHKLAGMTGTAETEASELWEIYKLDVIVIPTNRPIVRDDREDLVYKTVREKFNAVIEEVLELRDAGRPVLVGTTSVEISELLSRMLKMKGIKHNVLNAKQNDREADIVAEAGQAGTITIATNMAGRGTDIKLGVGVKEAGGLAIIGTERHDSRRVDRQLRGRAGRQGDPGSSQFFVSLEDNLMRLFGSDRIAKLMDKMGYKEGEVIQHSMITKSIERAQKKVEENNFGIRKRLLDYDDVMNRQREVIYKRRRHALFGERLSVDLYNSFYDLCEEVVRINLEGMDYANFRDQAIRFFSVDTAISEEEFTKGNPDELVNKLYEESTNLYLRKSGAIAKKTAPVIENVFINRGETVENIVVPFTDGRKSLKVVANLKKAYESKGKTLTKDLEKSVSLAFLDEAWKEHLRKMDELKQAVQMAVHEQKDPLLIYKFEAFELFKTMVSDINRDVSSFLFKADLPMRDPDDVQEAQQRKRTDMSRMKAGRDNSVPGVGGRGAAAGAASGQASRKAQPVRVGKKVGRNEPCPCGSGKKYKQCHGKDA